MWRLTINPPDDFPTNDSPPDDPQPEKRHRLNHKKAWALPLVLAAATVVKYLADAALAELAANWLPAPLKIVAQWLDAADAEYIIAVSAAAGYWAVQENLKTAALEFCKMAYENFFQATRRKLLNNARSEGRDEGRAELFEEIKDQLTPETRDRLSQTIRNGSNGNAGAPDDPR